MFSHIIFGVLECWRLARAQLFVEFDQGSLSRGMPAVGVIFRFLVEGILDIGMIGVVIHISEESEDLLIRASVERRLGHAVVQNCQRAQKDRNRHCALAVEFQDDEVILAGLELHPGSAVRDQLGGGHHPPGGAIQFRLKINAWRADQLRNNHAFGTINNESTLLGHLREIPQEQVLFLFFTQFAAFQQNGNIERAGIGQIAFKALLHCVLGRFKPVFKFKFFGKRRVTGEVQTQLTPIRDDRRDFVEQTSQTLIFETLERIKLDLDELGQSQSHRDPGIIFGWHQVSHQYLLT